MSIGRMGGTKWADVEEDDDETPSAVLGKDGTGTRFETPPDKDGIKTVIEYTERNSQTYKVTRKVKVTTITKKTNRAIMERKEMERFGKALKEESNSNMVVQSVEDVFIELSKKPGGGPQISAKDDAEDKFLEESLTITESLFKEKKAWTSKRAEEGEAMAADADKKPEETSAAISAVTAGSPATGNAAATTGGPGQPAKYMPPSLRGQAAAAGKGGKPGELTAQQQQEASLRITNLSEDVREGDLQDLFGQCGRLQRVYLAKDMTTFQSKGFAFITYYNREDAQKAITKLNGHGYDNLILQVNWAKPRT